jgi:hypothetical protein
MNNENSNEDQARKEQFNNIQVDNQTMKVTESSLTGEAILGLVGKRPCRYALIQLLPRQVEKEIMAQDFVDISKPGVERFKTQSKQRVTITVDGSSYEVEAGQHTVTDVLGLVGKSVEGYDLLEEKSGPPMPIPPTEPVSIEGCEIFHSQVKSGGSS